MSMLKEEEGVGEGGKKDMNWLCKNRSRQHLL